MGISAMKRPLVTKMVTALPRMTPRSVGPILLCEVAVSLLVQLVFNPSGVAIIGRISMVYAHADCGRQKARRLSPPAESARTLYC